MKIFFLGDYKSNSGPSNVNKKLINNLEGEVNLIKNNYWLNKVIEVIYKTLYSKVVIISGYSKLNLLSIVCSRLLGKTSIYLIHGCLEYENEINDLGVEQDVKIERKLYKYVDKILCVSENFSVWFKKRHPEFSHKVGYLNNAIDWDVTSEREVQNRNSNQIITMGGGRPQKNNVVVCKAINLLNTTKEMNLELVVLGEGGKELEEIKSYDFVNYVGQTSQKEAFFYLQQSNLFIQNSSFESFGLATVEALQNGCNMLVSSEVGALCIIKSISQSDIIVNYNDVKEIAEKIEYNLRNSNNRRLLESIDKEETSFQFSAKVLNNIIKKVREEKNI
jgi:glycosyltransferase involved in cell wall biosynthesis